MIFFIKKVIATIFVFVSCIVLYPLETMDDTIEVTKVYEYEMTPLMFTKKIDIMTLKNISINKFEKFIFVGDSRFVAMEKFSDDLFICETGEGYNYLIDNLDKIEDYYTENSLIIIGFGINDLNNIDLYINTINKLSDNYNMCFLTVNPIDEVKCKDFGYTITNNQIDLFNTKLVENLNSNVIILDTNSHLKQYGFITDDGIHYNNETYLNIYNYIKNYFKGD